MKRNNYLRGLNVFFSLVGFLVITGLIIVFVTNAAGLSTFISVLGLVKTQSLYDIDTPKIFEGAASGVVGALGDPYSQYLDKKTWQDLQIRLDAKFGGIGVYVLQDDAGRLKIYSPIKGTPAYEEGVKHGDIIVKINGENATGMTQDDAVHLLRGDPGTQLLLTVYRESDGQEYEFKIIRRIINVPSVEDKILDEAGQVGYIRLNQFHSRSTQEMADSINKMLEKDHIQGLILDLRDNGGGDFDAAIAIADMFLGDVEVVSAADTRGNKKVYRGSAGKIDTPMVVLVNQDSASASEILAAALQDNRRAVLVGQRTFGKGLVQTVFPLRDGGALKLTTQKYFTPRGTDINEIGIHPDYVVENPKSGDSDVQLQKALELIKQQIY